MFECECCGFRFTEPKMYRDLVEFWGRMAYEEVEGCPRCGGCFIEREVEDEGFIGDGYGDAEERRVFPHQYL